MAYAFIRLLLNEDGLTLDTKEDEIYNFVINASKGKLDFEEIKAWIQKNLKK